MIATKDKTFDDLNFLPHGNHSNAIQARLDLGDGFEISVVTTTDGKHGLYGHESAGTYEVAVFHNDDFVPLSTADDVLGWQTKDDINDLMSKLQGDPDKIHNFIDGLYLAKSEMRSYLDLDNPHKN